MEQSKAAYAIAVDKELHRIFNFFANLYATGSGMQEFFKEKGLHDRYEQFCDDWGEMSHEAGFCEDPDCDYKKDKQV